MRICLINNLFEPYQAGGAGMAVKRTAEALIRAGHQVTVISVKPFFDMPEIKPDIGYKNYYINSFFFLFKKLPVFFRLIFHLSGFINIFTAKKIIKILKKEKIEIVFTHNLIGIGFMAIRLLGRQKIKHAHVLHDIQLLHPSGILIYGEEKKINALSARLYQTIVKFYFIKAGKIISPSAWLWEEHRKKGFFSQAERLICRNPLDFKINGVNKHNESKKYCDILFIGNISREKGAGILLDAFGRVKEKCPEARLIMAGAEIDNQIVDRARKSKNVEFKGFLSGDDIKKTMLTARILVMPSICYENSPTVIYEAAALGLPVLASNIGGVPELAEIAEIELFEPGSVQDLEKKLLNKIKKPPKPGTGAVFTDSRDYARIILNFIN